MKNIKFLAATSALLLCTGGAFAQSSYSGLQNPSTGNSAGAPSTGTSSDQAMPSAGTLQDNSGSSASQSGSTTQDSSGAGYGSSMSGSSGASDSSSSLSGQSTDMSRQPTRPRSSSRVAPNLSQQGRPTVGESLMYGAKTTEYDQY